MAVLTVPSPNLDFEAPAPSVAVLEKKIEIQSDPVLYDDGREFTQQDAAQAGFFVYRAVAPAATPEIWDATEQTWKPESVTAVETLKPTPLIFKEAAAPRWSFPLVAAGKKDKNGAPQFQKASGLFPSYFVRAWFAAKPNGAQTSTGLSAPSATFRFLGLTDSMRAGLGVGPDEKPENATQIRMFLRNPQLATIGMVEIRQSGGGAEVEISNPAAGGARIRLLASGDIEITPAPGGKIRLQSVVEYVPGTPSGAATGPARYLA